MVSLGILHVSSDMYKYILTDSFCCFMNHVAFFFTLAFLFSLETPDAVVVVWAPSLIRV